MKVEIAAPESVIYIINNSTLPAVSQEEDALKNTILTAKYAQKMQKTIKNDVSEYFASRGQAARAARVKECANVITFRRYSKLKYRKLDSINLCRERLCINCQTALAQKNSKKVFFALTSQKDQLYHMVLTVPSVKGEDLNKTIKRLQEKFAAFCRKYGIKNYYRSLEITHSKAGFHPHYHIITDWHTSERKLRGMWGKMNGKQYLQAHIAPLTDKRRASYEMSKYITKPQNITKETIPTLNKEVSGVRLRAAGGNFKKLLHEYDAEEEERKVLLSDLLDSYDYELERYIWNGDNYVKNQEC